ncbi:MobF family relaxase [Novosphingobium sp. ST904]|uniref:MobF family relaxase n=1 Tax=Novosphingobium sp. ST904 TaxID=1684385 RepID=UPI0006C863C2|nr:MobF family relaxase [Novosphingobium sp. ST904]KPH63555.1 ATPase AAA [Novosphingobium sp. ST904]TCM32389.1 conjugative relaxase-like TrwC/TraI family protein [Novosphingobium sp. ST904]
MHSISAVRSASGAAKYFTADDLVSGEYYTAEHAGEVSQWAGEGVKDSPLAPGTTVTREAFEKVLNGETPNGEQLRQFEGRRPGIDMTFSAPKSVSLMAYIAGDKRILGPEGAHLKAVQKTMAWVEKNLAETRKDVDGKKVPVQTGNLVYALFQHDTSRARDPQAHVHAVVANMTRLPDGTWQALHNDRIWQSNSVIGTIYHANLRDEMEKLGYKVQLDGKHGTFEIVGVPRAVIDAFSQRREEILMKSEALGIVSPKGRDSLSVNTRDAKVKLDDRDELVKEWIEKAESLGFNGKEILEAALRASREQPENLAVRGYKAMLEVVNTAREFVSGLLRSPEPLVDAGIARFAQSPADARAQLAVASAVRILGQREAAFQVHQVAKTALDLGLKGVTIDHVEARIDRLIAKGDLVAGEIRHKGRLVEAVTTPEALKIEQTILDRVEAGNGRAIAIVDAASAPTRLQEAAAPRELNQGQLAAATMIVSGTDRFVAVQGVAGAGKSTMLQAVATLAREEGRQVLGLAFQNKMVGDMREGMVPRHMSAEDMEKAGVSAQTIASFVWQNEKYLSDPASPGAQARRDELAGTIVVVDETSMVSSEDMLKLMRIIEALGIGRVAFVGDRQQLSSIDAGKSFAMVQAGGITMARMEQNVRINPENKQLLTVAALANTGKAGAALKVLGENVTEHESPAQQAADTWLALSAQERAATAVFASGRETRAEINSAIQEGLLREGTLKGDGLYITVHDKISKEREQLRYAHHYTMGQTLTVTGQVREVGLGRGQYQVARVFENGKVQVTGPGGRSIRFDPQRIDPAIRRDRLELSALQTVKIHEGDTIRWTATDKERGLDNSALARIVSIEGGNVTVETASKEQVTLGRGDPMLSRLDLAYALNMHMAQGVTADKAIGVMLSYEHNLSNQRLFNVLVTRVRDGLTMIVDDRQKLEWRLDSNPGDKTSSLESIGRLDIDGPGAKAAAADAALTAAFDSLEGGNGGGAGGLNGPAAGNGAMSEGKVDWSDVPAFPVGDGAEGSRQSDGAGDAQRSDGDRARMPDPDPLNLNDLPPMGVSDTDYAKYEPIEIDGEPIYDPGADESLSAPREKEDIDPLRQALLDHLEGDGLGVVDRTVDDLTGIPPMPGRDPDLIPGLPEKNLGLDL